MMIMGEVCTRACSFCNIATGKPPDALDVFEPGRVADAVAKLGLQHVVIIPYEQCFFQHSGIYNDLEGVTMVEIYFCFYSMAGYNWTQLHKSHSKQK